MKRCFYKDRENALQDTFKYIEKLYNIAYDNVLIELLHCNPPVK